MPNAHSLYFILLLLAYYYEQILIIKKKSLILQNSFACFFFFFGDINIFKFFNEPLEKRKNKIKNYEVVTNHEMDK